MSDRQAPVCGGSEKEKERRFHAALRTASNILGYAECSPARLREKLSVRGYERELIDAVLDRLRGAGLLDEDAMARRKAEMLCRVKGYGPRRILPELRRLGFSSAVIDEVDLSGEDFDFPARAAALLRKRGVIDQKALAALSRAGFTADQIRAAVRTVKEEENEENEI